MSPVLENTYQGEWPRAGARGDAFGCACRSLGGEVHVDRRSYCVSVCICRYRRTASESFVGNVVLLHKVIPPKLTNTARQ